MYRILIIDDEAIIRQGLIGYIDWNRLNCIIAADFENGLQAIEYLKSESVDIIISDIKMPGADGISVAKYVHENCPETKVILYTGYSDFEYAKSAIKYDVSDFIVKPSTMDNIMNIIQDNIKKIEEQVRRDNQLTTLENQLQRIHHKEKLNVIRDFVEGIKMDQTTIEKTLKQYNIDVNQFCLLLFKISSEKPFNDTQTLHFINLSLKDLDQYTFILNRTTYGTLISLDNMSPTKYEKQLIQKCEDINAFVTEYINGSIYIGISQKHNAMSEAPIAFMEAQQCLDSSFYEQNPITVYSQYDGPKDNPTFAERSLEEISSHLNKNDELETIKTISSMFKTMSANKEPIDYTKSMGIAVYTILMNVIHRQSLRSSDIFSDVDPYHEILSAESLDNLIEILCHMVHRIFSYLSEGNNNYIIKQVNEYIQNNYQNNIKLTDIASHIPINSSYLSRLYKEKTNQTVTSAIRNVRINKAKELLQSSKLKTYEIAEITGFDDSAYFSYVFKHETGISPSQFRNKNT